MTFLGILLLLLVAYEAYTTILDVRGRAGPISDTLTRSLWRTTHFIAFYFSRHLRHKLLNIIGPLLLPILVAILIVMLITGFALIYLPRMPDQFLIAAAPRGPLWIEAFYFSSITLATVGYGDITPVTTGMRLVAMFEGALGFTLIPLALTYMLSVYGALSHKRTLARYFYHRAEGGPDVAGFLSHHFVSNKFYGLDASLRRITGDLQEQMEAHVEHPVIHFFHPVEVYKGLPRVLFLALEISTVIQSCLERETYPEANDHPEVLTLEDTARHVLWGLLTSLRLKHLVKQPNRLNFDGPLRWEPRFKLVLGQLNRAGIKTRSDTQTAWEIYKARREEWESQLYVFAHYLGYDWDEVTGDGNMQYAVNETLDNPTK
jgi:hypothetical protein